MFRVKICGITNQDDALAVAEAGGDAIGLNFYAGSPRHCNVERAEKIVQVVPKGICKVGVFVNAPPTEIRDIFRRLSLDLVQLHGDEPPEQLRQLAGLPVIRAFRLSGDPADVGRYMRECYRLMCLPRMILVDAFRSGQFGGTGSTADWELLRSERRHLSGAPLVLAGGLTPSNIAAAIETVRPWAVDVASGVESKPGKKSVTLVREFVVEAKAAFSRVSAAN